MLLVQTAPARIIEAGPLTLEVRVGSRIAHLFHVVDQLSAWSEYCHPQYRRYWEEKFGPFTPEEKGLLAEHAAIRMRRGWGSLEPIFYTPEELEKTLADPRLGAADAATERRVFAKFAVRIEQLVKEESEAAERFAGGIERRREELAAFATKAGRLFGTKALRIPVYLLANPDDRMLGGGYNGGRLTLEIPRKSDPFPSFLHEVLHSFLEGHIPALDAAARGVPGLNGQTLNEGICYALSPGLLHASGPNADPLAMRVATDLREGRRLSDAYTRFNRFGLALRPLVKSSLDDPQATFATVLPRAVDTWRTLHELSHALQPPERPRIVSFGPGWETLNDHVWGLGYTLSANTHDEDHYRRVLAGAAKGETVVLLYAGDFNPKFRDVPAPYRDLLPRPMPEIEAALARDETLEVEGTARGFRVILLAAPTEEKLKALIAQTKRIGIAPKNEDF